ncbi:UNVERIFIED_CONTAM: hypothetical protein RMT77_001282 [Armadillidium vulgare]
MDLIGLYEEVYDLLENKCKQDPPSDPYKSKYEARKKLEAMKCILIVELETSSEDEKQAWKKEFYPLVKAQFATVLLHIGIISLETEELSVGQEYLQKVVDFTSGFEMSPRCICLAVLCYNNLAVLFAHLDKQEKARQNLTVARDLYNKYKTQDNPEPPLSIHELFLTNLSSKGFEVLESLHTLTLYYLAQVMGKLGDHIASAKLCLTTLHRQLSSGEYHTSSWAVNAATLAKFYQDNNKFGVARRLLAAAWTLLDDYHAENSVEDSKSSEHLGEDSNEKLLEAKAEVNRRFGMYCVSLMQESYNVLSEENPKEEMSENKEDSSEDKCLEQMEFCKLDLSYLESKIECEKVTSYEEAKKLFISGLEWLNKAKSLYTLNDYASSHAEIIQDMSTLYKLLAHFETEPDRRSKMHKRRIDLLTPILEELNVEYYMQFYRQINYELGETNSAMVDCKYEALNSKPPNEQQGKKINLLVLKGIHYFQSFLASFNDKDGKKPERYPEENERPVLVAYFHMGRLWSKKVSVAQEEKLEDIKNTLENYKFLVDYCDRNTDCAPLMSLELPVCREMVDLLPYKMQRIRNQV